MSIKIKEAIKHYQRALDRSKDEERTVHCISKLFRLSVTVQHLKETGIGKTVNALRKYDGKIGESAKLLVEKWKAMVAAEDSSDPDEIESEHREDSVNVSVSEISQDTINKDKEDSIKQGSLNNSSNNRDKSNHSESKSEAYRQKHKSKSDKKRSESSEKKEKHREKKSRDYSSEEKEVHSSKKEKNSKSHKKKDHKSHSSDDSKKIKSNSNKTNRSEEEICDQNSSKTILESHSKEKSKSKNKVENEKNKIDQDDGIDCYSGASFAEALNMTASVPSKKSSSFANPSSSNTSTKRKNDSSPNSPIKKPKLDPQTSLTLTSGDFEVDLKNTYVNESNYFNLIPTKSTTMTEEEALNQLMVTKNQRTKVYSGVKSNKSWSSIPSLFDCCIRVLQENIDAIEYTGGVPYSIIKPVLQHATSTQLFTLEESNAYLIEDTNELWDYHVKKEFRNKDRLPNESYREMFLRCLEEREVRLKAIASTISQNIARSTPARQTKLAYVDSHVKPPRNVARQQAKYGTSAVTKVPTKGAVKPNPAPRVVPMPRISSAKAKPKMAPLMQKTMKLAKSFKR